VFVADGPEEDPRQRGARQRSSRAGVAVGVAVVGLLALGGGGVLLAQLFDSGAPRPSRVARDGPKAPGKAPPPSEGRKRSELAQRGEEAPAPAAEGAAEAGPAWVGGGPIDLSELDKKLERYHRLIKPQPGEWKFSRIPWAATVWEARKKAADEGKPLFIWYMTGEPLGQC
jgi:hypothetical protein